MSGNAAKREASVFTMAAPVGVTNSACKPEEYTGASANNSTVAGAGLAVGTTSRFLRGAENPKPLRILILGGTGFTGPSGITSPGGVVRPTRRGRPPRLSGSWIGIQAGQPLKILNSDGTLHNIHALPKINAEFNIGQPFQKMETLKKFDKPEVPLRFKCDVHNWMGAYCGVFNHPFYAVTNDQGTFEIKGLPPGNYVIEAWQEKYGPQDQNVTISGSESKTVDFGFKG